MKKIYLLLALIFPILLNSQDFNYKNYDWEENPVRADLTEKELSESSLILKRLIAIEYVLDDEDDLYMFETNHKIIRINNSKGIERYNKVYVSLDDVVEIVEMKARTINSDGKVVDLDQNSIKEVDNLENFGAFKMFAFEGIEEGSEIELLYTIKFEPSLYSREFLQDNQIAKNVNLEIISPEHLIFTAKGYNGLPDIIDTIIDEKHYVKVSVDSIPPIREEKYSAGRANMMRVEYKYKKNTMMSNSEIYTWARASKQIFEYLVEQEVKERKKVHKVLSKLKLKSLSEEEQVVAIENYVKTNFVTKPIAPGVDATDLDFILKRRYSSQLGIIKLYMTLFAEADIEHQLVITNDRFEAKFDKDFMSWYYLDEYLIYFPKLKKFITPTEFDYRYSMIPETLTNTNGLFLKSVKIGDMYTAVPKMGFINADDGKKNFSKLELDISFPESMDEASIDMIYTFSGQNAMFLQPYYNEIDIDERDEVVEEVIKMIGDDANIKEKKIINVDPNISPSEKPMIIESNLTMSAVLENAGENYLFNIGNLIGQQVEMYSEEDRKTPMEIDYPHILLRELTFTVPDGYVVKGLDKLKINIEHGAGEENTVGFVSDYVIDGNKVTISVNEYYYEYEYPIEIYEEFKEVINAAADFNKIVLVFEKE